MIALRFLSAVAIAGVTGLAVLSRLGSRPRSGPGQLGMGFVVGAVVLALWIHLLLLIRIPVSTLTLLAGPAILIPLGRWRILREGVWERPPWPAALVAAAGVFLFMGAIHWPLAGADPEYFYIFKAKSIVRHGTFWNPDFLDPDRLHPAHRRPLLLPCFYVIVRLVAGSFEVPLIRAWMALFQVGALCAMYDVIRARADRTTAALGAGLYGWLPVLWHDAGGAVTGYADAPLAMMILFALASETPLAVLFAAAAPLLKDDAVPFVAGFAIARGLKPALLPAAVAACWQATAAFLPLDPDYLPQRFLHPYFGQLPFIFRRILSEIVSVKHWSLAWVAIIAAAAGRACRLDRSDLRWLAPGVLQLAAYVGVWMSFEPESGRFFVRMQCMRLLLHVMPILWVWALWRAVPDVDRAAAEG